MTVLLDWPRWIVPSDLLVWPAAALETGRISRAGLDNDVRISGGRTMLEMALLAPPRERGHWYAWLAGNLAGNLFAVLIDRGVQVADTPQIRAARAARREGLPFANGVPFSNGRGWRFVPSGDVMADVAEGDVVARIDLARWPGALKVGKVFGLGRAVYMVDGIDWDGEVATVEFSPPARRDILAGEICELFPTMICKAVNPDAALQPISRSGHGRAGTLTFREVVDVNLL